MKTITIIVQGQMFRVKTQGEPPPRPDLVRGKVAGFSQASRRRVLELCARLERHAAGRVTFCTLTYPPRFPGPREAKEHLRALLERIRRNPKYAGMSAIWKLEPQDRGAPHFHLLFFNAPFIPHAKLYDAWSDIVSEYRDGPGGYVWLNEVRSWNQVMSYVSKYMGKKCTPEPKSSGPGLLDPTSYPHAGPCHPHPEVDDWKTPGRWWGIFAGSDLPFDEIRVVELPDGAWFESFLKKSLERSPWLKQLSMDYYVESFTLIMYGGRVTDWLSLLADEYGSDPPSEKEVREWESRPTVWGSDRTDLCKLDRDALDAHQMSEWVEWAEQQPETGTVFSTVEVTRKAG